MAAATLKLEPFSWELLAKRGVEVLFLATPHEQSREWVPEALARGLRVIDLSGAWRLTEAEIAPSMHLRTRALSRPQATQAQAVYGMPELHRATDCRRTPGRQSRLLCDFGHSCAAAAGGCGTGRS